MHKYDLWEWVATSEFTIMTFVILRRSYYTTTSIYMFLEPVKHFTRVFKTALMCESFISDHINYKQVISL